MDNLEKDEKGNTHKIYTKYKELEQTHQLEQMENE